MPRATRGTNFRAQDLAMAVEHAITALSGVSAVLNAMRPNAVLVKGPRRRAAVTRALSAAPSGDTITIGPRPFLAGYCPPPKVTVVPARKKSAKK